MVFKEFGKDIITLKKHYNDINVLTSEQVSKVNLLSDSFNNLKSKGTLVGEQFNQTIEEITDFDKKLGGNDNLTNYFKSVAEGAENARVNIVDAYAAILDSNTHGLKNVQSIFNTYNKSFEN